MQDLSTPHRRLFTARFALVLVAQTVFGFGWSLYLITPKFLAVVLGAHATTIGRLAATGGFAAVLSVPLTALGLDRVGRRPFFQLGSAFLVLVSLSYLGVDRIGPLAYFAQGCTGAAFVLSFNGTATLVADLAPPARLGQAIGVLGAANLSMNAVATVIAERVADRYGWPMVFRLGIGAGCAALVLSLFIRESTAKERGSEPGDGKEAIALAPFLPLFLTSALSGAAFTALFTFHQPYALLLGQKNVQGFFVGFTFSAVMSRVVFGSLGDRFGRRRVSGIAAIFYGVAALAMVRLDPNLLVLYGVIFGAAHGVLYPTLNALVLELLPSSWRGRAMTLYNGAFNLGSALSGLAWGALADGFGYGSVFAGAAVIGAFAATILLAGQSAPARAAIP